MYLYIQTYLNFIFRFQILKGDCAKYTVGNNKCNQHYMGKYACKHFPWYTNGSRTSSSFFGYFIIGCGWHRLSPSCWHCSAKVMRLLIFFYVYFVFFFLHIFCQCYISHHIYIIFLLSFQLLNIYIKIISKHIIYT